MRPLDSVETSDVLDFLRGVSDHSVQLVIADPPYNLGPKFGNAKEWINDDDWIGWCAEWLAECKRVLTDDGNLFVYGIHHYMAFVQVELYKLGLEYRRQIIWNYENGFSSYKRSLAAHYEPILWFSKSADYYFEEIREPYKSQDRLKNKIFKNGKEWVPNPKGRIAGDVWRFPTLAGKRFAAEKVDHPTQKPLSLSNRIVNHFSEPGATVLVPFAGSGSECVAAKSLGRHFLACELNETYVGLAHQRLQATAFNSAILPG